MCTNNSDKQRNLNLKALYCAHNYTINKYNEAKKLTYR